MKIKICGIRNENEVEAINEALPDFCGFIFAKSKRQIDFETAHKLKTLINPLIQTVGVFVDTPVKNILKFAEIIDFAQLHAEAYTESDISYLQKNGLKTIKVVRVNKDFINIETNAKYALLDAFSPVQAGGLNKTFNWDIQIKSNVPFFVAGGLNTSNIEKMAEKLKPYGADVSSGAEIDGIKTKSSVSAIVNLTRGIKL